MPRALYDDNTKTRTAKKQKRNANHYFARQRAFVLHVLPHAAPGAIKVWTVLQNHAGLADRKDPPEFEVWPSVTTLMKETGDSHGTVCAALRELEHVHHVIRTVDQGQGQGSARRHLLVHPGGRSKVDDRSIRTSPTARTSPTHRTTPVQMAGLHPSEELDGTSPTARTRTTPPTPQAKRLHSPTARDGRVGSLTLSGGRVGADTDTKDPAPGDTKMKDPAPAAADRVEEISLADAAAALVPTEEDLVAATWKKVEPFGVEHEALVIRCVRKLLLGRDPEAVAVLLGKFVALLKFKSTRNEASVVTGLAVTRLKKPETLGDLILPPSLVEKPGKFFADKLLGRVPVRRDPLEKRPDEMVGMKWTDEHGEHHEEMTLAESEELHRQLVKREPVPGSAREQVEDFICERIDGESQQTWLRRAVKECKRYKGKLIPATKTWLKRAKKCIREKQEIPLPS